MLYIIGIGINEFESLAIGSMEILRNSDIVYVERFTGFISDEFVQNLSDTYKIQADQNQETISILSSLRDGLLKMEERSLKMLKNPMFVFSSTVTP